MTHVLVDLSGSGQTAQQEAVGATAAGSRVTPCPAGLEDPPAQAAVGVRLRGVLAELGLSGQAVESVALSAEVLGALARGEELGEALLTTPVLDGDATEGGSRTPDELEPASSGEDAGAESGGMAPEGVSPEVAGASVVLSGVEALTQAGARLDAALVAAARELTARTGRVLLTRRGVGDPGELTARQREIWRCRAKSLTRAEVAAAIGWGQGEVADLVGVGTAPAPVLDTVTAALVSGVASWRLVRRYWMRCSSLDHADAAHIAAVLFGDDPGLVAPERLTVDGEVSSRPWGHRVFYRALDREVAKVTGRDPAAARAAREQVLAGRDIAGTIHQDGTGSLVVHGAATQVAAVVNRADTAARRARAAGDGRTLAQLRADLCWSLLTHAQLNLPDLPEGSEVVGVAYSQQLAAVLAGLPPARLEVIVPYTILNPPLPGHPVLDPHRQATLPLNPQAPPGGSDPDESRLTGEDWSPGEGCGPGEEPADPSLATGSAAATEAAGAATGAAFFRTPGTAATAGPLGADPPGAGPLGQAPPGGPPGGGVEVLSAGMVTGALSWYVTADVVRELALAPGTVLHRLLIDPADGRCVERSIRAYRPDAAMRTQILAADVTCRGPVCVHPATSAQLDHVIEFSSGGATSEVNLQALHTGDHAHKTHRFWSAVMGPARDVTWTTLLGRIYRTRVHDYRAYTTVVSTVLADLAATPAPDRAAAADAAVYTALAHRAPTDRLAAMDDSHDAETYLPHWDLITLTHTTPDGQRRPGPPPPNPVDNTDCSDDGRSGTCDTDRDDGTGDTDRDDGSSDEGSGRTPREPDTPWTTRQVDEDPPF